MNDLDYMNLALQQAQLAYDADEVPVGAIIVFQDNVIAQSYNSNQINNNPLQHAEINVIDQASKVLKSNDLSACSLYVTLEPCMMCYGAIINAKIGKVFFGAYDLEYGAIISNQFYKDNKKTNWVPGVYKEECSQLLKKYFKNKREEK